MKTLELIRLEAKGYQVRWQDSRTRRHNEHHHLLPQYQPVALQVRPLRFDSNKRIRAPHRCKAPFYPVLISVRPRDLA